MTETLEALSHAAFVVDAAQKILSVTRAGTAALSEEHFVRSRQGRLEAVDGKSDAGLQAALQSAFAVMPELSCACLRSRLGGVLIADVAPLTAAAHIQRFGHSAIVTMGRLKMPPNTARSLRTVFDLSPAETAIVQALLDGKVVSQIALDRASGVETVRKQLKTVFSKMGVDSQSALMRRLAVFIAPQ